MIPTNAQKASAPIHAEAETILPLCRSVFIGNRLLPDGILRAPVGQYRRPVVVRLRLKGNRPQSQAPFQGEENDTLRSKTAAATLSWDCRGRFSADSQHPSAPISEAKV